MAELGLLSLTQLQKLALSQQNTHQSNPRPVWMWNPKQAQQDQEDDSWEVRAFAEDTGNVMGTTWPPRSYTCTFCRREFRSAQALGGHMNVHRRDRARLHQVQHPSSISINPSTVSSNSNSSYIIPTQEFLAANGGLCLLYQLPSPNNGAFGNIGTTPTLTATFNNTSSLSSPHVNVDQSSSSAPVPSTLFSISPNNIPPPHDHYLMTSPPSCNFVGISNSGNSRTCRSKRSADHQDHQASRRAPPGVDENDSNIEELDLELRLGPS